MKKLNILKKMKNKKIVLFAIILGLNSTNINMFNASANSNLIADSWIDLNKDKVSLKLFTASAVVDKKAYYIGGQSMLSNTYSKSILSNAYNKVKGLGGYVLDEVEVYDPEKDSWEIKTPMPTARYGLTASVVDGKIYCIGGYNDSGGAINKVEVYDPEKDSWEIKTPMPTARALLTSAVVDGKIYVFGGSDENDNPFNVVEVYNPATDKWETKTNMLTARDGLTSSVVNGKIYCIGGYDESWNITNKVEVYDPEEDKWETKKNMPTARSNLSSVVAYGKIYNIGGIGISNSRLNVTNTLNVVEVYDPEEDSWETKSPMLKTKFGLNSSLINNKIYCMYGIDYDDMSPGMDIYDIESDIWSSKISDTYVESRIYTSSVAIGKKIYNIGGANTSYESVGTLQVYDLETNKWETKSPMPTARCGFTASVVDGKIYNIGGIGISNSRLNVTNTLNVVEVYDPEKDSWEIKTPMPTARYGLTASVVDGKIYCIGGIDNSYNVLNIIEVYDPEKDSWEIKTPMPTARDGLTSAVIDGKIYCIGGMNDNEDSLNVVEVYDPEKDSWESKTPMPTSRYALTSSVVDGKIYCIGGQDEDWNITNKVEVYDPARDKWDTSKTPMLTATAMLTSSVVDGKIYCIGGMDEDYTFMLNNLFSVYITDYALVIEATQAVEKAEQSRNPEDIENARYLVNKLPESIDRESLKNRLDNIFPELTLDRKTYTANLDIYIKSENMLRMTLDTNSVTFEDYSGINEIEKQNAVKISINSSLPYQLNAYLISDIQNADGSKKIDIDRLQIKENSNDSYSEFTAINDKLVLKDSCEAGNDKEHNINLKLKGDYAYPADIYKTTIKFEAEQK